MYTTGKNVLTHAVQTASHIMLRLSLFLYEALQVLSSVQSVPSQVPLQSFFPLALQCVLAITLIKTLFSRGIFRLEKRRPENEMYRLFSIDFIGR